MNTMQKLQTWPLVLFFCGNDILFLMCKLSKCHCRLFRGAVILCGPLMMLILSVCVNSGIVLDALFLNKG